MMSDVFYLRPMAPPTTPEAVLEGSKHAGGCFHLHRVDWTHSFVADDGGRMLCWYRAPDAESVRIALRELGADMNAVWPGRVIGAVGPRDAAVSRVDVLAEVPLGETFQGGDDELLKRLESAAAGDDAVTFRFGLVSNRRDRMVCLLEAEEAEPARAALERVGLPARSVWSCRVVTPAPIS